MRSLKLPKKFLLACLTIIMLAVTNVNQTKAHECRVENVRRTFVQLWNKDSQSSVEEWEQKFSQLKRIGFSEVILQWTSYGWLDRPTENYRDDSYSEIYLLNIFQAAKQQKIKVWLGLHYDPSWWDRIEVNDRLTQKYLNLRAKKTSSRIKVLSQLIQQSDRYLDIVAGWYIADEIDDVNWNTENKFNLLTNYLSSVTQALYRENLDLPIAISAFANGNLSPTALSSFLLEVTNKSNIDILLFQDGIGVKKLSLAQLKQYLPPLANKFSQENKSLGLIVELFQLTKNDSLAVAAYSRIAQQISLANKWSNEPLTVFSALDHLIAPMKPKAKLLLKRWRKEYRQCTEHRLSN